LSARQQSEWNGVVLLLNNKFLQRNGDQ